MNLIDSILSAYGGVYGFLIILALFFLLSLVLIFFTGGGKDE